ncbi:unnamed protein product [Cylindrotheca closterium]|uniref:Orc1-like AAA ATPase domain-containing protein n=1 Tax=Cylindrotheca closterium TaxID=2856 RepID=A0AAD2CWA6_9STRA|nr:unnamed protein product [Cylindrotheca closterium]
MESPDGTDIGDTFSKIFIVASDGDDRDQASSIADSEILSYEESASNSVFQQSIRTEVSSELLMADMKSCELRKQRHSELRILRDATKASEEMEKLNFESVGLVSREHEINSLKKCFNRMLPSSIDDTNASDNSAKKELVFLSGFSGSGKTSLAQTVESDVVRFDAGIFVEGKFDQTTSDKPYSGVAKAFGKIFERTNQMTNKTRERLQAEILQEFGNDVETLVDLIPELKFIIPEYSTRTISADANDPELANGLERLRFAFRTLTRALSAEFFPMVIVLDDLHWADILSLQILDYLITDTNNPNPLMIIGCYRSDLADENSVLANKILGLESKTTTHSFNMTKLNIESLNADDICSIIKSQIPTGSEASIKELAALCVKRTMGNPYFVLEFLKMLKNEDLLTYNAEAHIWKWNLSQIEHVTMSTANVVILLQSKMQKMPMPVQHIMQYAACIGSSFSLSILELIWKKSKIFRHNVRNEPLQQLIDIAEENYFFEQCGTKRYRWVHDKVQEAALLLSTKSSFQLHVGSSLYYSLDEKGLEEELFNVADIINSGNVSKRPEFARLNFRAAEKARGIYAIQSAANYTAKGIELLQDSEVLENRGLWLQLYTIGAEMELALGNGEKAELYSKEVLSRDMYSTMEKMPLMIASVRKLATVDSKCDEAIEGCLELLHKLGYRLLWSKNATPIQALVELRRTVRKVKGASGPKTLCDSLGHLKDEKQQMRMRLIATLGYAAHRTKRSLLYLLSVCKNVQITLKCGIGKDSGVSFASLGLLVLAFQADFETAAKITEMGLAIQKALGPGRKGACLYMSYAFSLSWKLPFQACLRPLFDGYASAIRVGDSVFALWSLTAQRVWLPYMMGKPLRPILEDVVSLHSQMEDFSLQGLVMTLRVVWQMLINLTCDHPHAHQLEGEKFSRRSLNERQTVGIGMVPFAEGELLVFLKPEEAADHAIAVGNKFGKLIPGLCLGMIETFHRGVALYTMARSTRRRKYRVLANKIRKRINKCMQAGNPNVEYYSLVLEAEHSAMNGAYAKAEKHYNAAISLASKSGHLHHAALFNERYADFLRNERKDSDRAVDYLNEAIRFYELWGATKKVKTLKSSCLTAKID